ncbi:ComEA family DNA-binding protein [Longimicrobium sp.]|jgi:hypothetical protein|uniref:ComEA family DNA-binding protein n=1 Tax=Longimicrobium sp. TaxID=2029185 RepID=UPI002EDB5FB7
MAVTNRGAAWEWGQSWWILLTFCFGLLSGPAFLYAGRKTRTRKWVIAGFFYLVSWVALGLLPTKPKTPPAGAPPPAVAEPASPIPYSETANEVVGGIFMTLWLVSMVHAVWVRNEYLRRLDTVHGTDPYAHLRREVAEEAEFHDVPAAPWALFEGGPPPPPPPAPALPPRPVQPVHAEPAGTAVDLNNAPEDQLAALPGIGPVLARRAAEERRARGGFGSLEEFGAVLALKPHILERLRPRVVLGTPPTPSAPPAPGTGRRVVDF